MLDAPPPTLVVNFNSPELHQLALSLARVGALADYVRPYANKQRAWERAAAALPLVGSVYDTTLGRRRIGDPVLALRTREAGVVADWCAAATARLGVLSPELRRRIANRLHMAVREAVATSARRRVRHARCVVGYEGFALPAFEAARRLGGRATVLSYPVAHHRQRRRVREEENAREPDFAVTWPDFDDWPAGHEQRLDAEIETADCVWVGSSYVRDGFVAEGIARAKLRVIAYGVDLDTFHGGERRRDEAMPFRVIYAGQLTQRKGLSYLLRGYRRFARPDTRLTLVGSTVGSMEPLRPFAASFEHIPHQTRPALAAQYRASDVFVLPTLIEGMPLVVLEAMACGLPVIVTANGPGDIVRDGIEGFVIPQRDADAICDRLERLYRDPELRLEMGRRAAARAREYSWAAYAANARRLLVELCCASPSAGDLLLPERDPATT